MTDTKRKRIETMVKDGLTSYQIAAKEGVSVQTARRWMRFIGKRPKSKRGGRVRKMDEEFILEAWRAGKTADWIAENLGTHRQIIEDRMCRLGITPNNPNIDTGRIGALLGAGWSPEEIADDVKAPLHQVMEILKG